MNKFFLLLALAVVSLTLVAAEQKFKNVGADEFDKLRRQTNTIVLDVRTPKEFVAGHIPGATNIDWYASDFEKRASSLDKSKTYLVHCAAGRRGASASEKLTSLHFTNVSQRRVQLVVGYFAQPVTKPPAKPRRGTHWGGRRP